MSAWFPNPALFWLFNAVVTLWIASEVINRLISWLNRPKASSGIQCDRGSFWIVSLIIWGSTGLALLTRVLHLGVFYNIGQYVGLGLAVFGVIFREWAVFSLGQFFTVQVTIRSEHRLVTRGPYRWLRHPSYTGSLLTIFGFALALGTWVGAGLALGLSLAGFLYRVRVEEQALLAALGDDYREYMQHTWRLVPGF